MKQKFVHVYSYNILVPNSKESVDKADGYFEELQDVKTFSLSKEEFDELFTPGGLFDDFDRIFGTIIDDCEEDRIEAKDIPHAIAVVDDFLKRNGMDPTPAIKIIQESLQYAAERHVFREIQCRFE